MKPIHCHLRLSLQATVTLLLAALLLTGSIAAAAEIHPFKSDGCSLFPDGTMKDRTKWCDCCFNHDLAYWQGGSKAERQAADVALHDCVMERTGDEILAEAMYIGVRAGGHPAFPTWYRWSYGWDYGRGYQPLSKEEQLQVDAQLADFTAQHPQGYCRNAADADLARPAAWATPLPSETLKNLYRLDAKVYRAAQPSDAGFTELKSLGIANVLNLRKYHSDDDEAKGSSIKLFRVKMAAGSITTDQVIAALRSIQQSEGPILIHCWHGSDRTGMVSAMYRIVFQDWTKEQAIAELSEGGYGYHAFFYQNIPEFIRSADIDVIRAKVLAP